MKSRFRCGEYVLLDEEITIKMFGVFFRLVCHLVTGTCYFGIWIKSHGDGILMKFKIFLNVDDCQGRGNLEYLESYSNFG